METGTIINQYKIISAIGKGGMGEVFLAEDTKLKRQVALKILPPEFAEDKDRMSRFVREAQSASALNHPNIITIYEIGESDGTHFIATEFIDGKTLNDYKKANPLNYKSALEIAIQIASALDEAHSAGIVHRDIKPDNVMIRSNGLAKILDFGIAKFAEQKGRKGERVKGELGENEATLALSPHLPQSPSPHLSTSPGMIIGTANYMSPEQAKGKEVDARTDIFSFGVVLYEMIAGHLPFEGENALEMIGAILKDEPKPLNSDVPTEIKKIISKCLRKDRETRYQTIKDVGNDLKDVKQELELKNLMERSIVPNQDENKTQILKATTLDEINQTTTNQTVARNPKTKYLAAGLLTLLLAVGGFFGYKYFGSPPVNISLESSKSSRFTSSGKVWTTAISPDGKWLAYVIWGEKERSLWVKQVAVPDSDTKIVTVDFAVETTGLTFSPDGNFLFYSVIDWNVRAQALYQVGVLGGTPRKILDSIYGKVSFSPDGKQIAYYTSKDNEQKIMIANADGTEPRQLAVRRDEEFFFQPDSGTSWSPDGKTIATSIGTKNPQTMGVATVSVATGEVTMLGSQKFSSTARPTWLADGRGLLMLASESEDQPNQIWQISYPAGEYKKLSNDINGYSSISLTADSNVLAAMQRTGVSNISIVQTSEPNSVKQITTGSDRNHSPRWTPDGKLIYLRNSDSGSALYLADPREGSPKQLISNKGSIGGPAVSPDGRYIVFSSSRSGTRKIWRVDADGSNPIQLTNTEDDLRPNISPDGREVIYDSFKTRSNNSVRVWKVSMVGGQPVQLTEKECSSPRFSPDGKQFICSYKDDPKSPGKIAVYSSDGGSPIKLLDPPQALGLTLRWMPDGRTITYVVNKAGVGNIWSKPLEGGTPKQITNFTDDSIGSFDFSRDGKQIAIARGTTSSDVVLITGIKR